MREKLISQNTSQAKMRENLTAPTIISSSILFSSRASPGWPPGVFYPPNTPVGSPGWANVLKVYLKRLDQNKAVDVYFGLGIRQLILMFPRHYVI